jgi:hypothetical protein
MTPHGALDEFTQQGASTAPRPRRIELFLELGKMIVNGIIGGFLDA